VLTALQSGSSPHAWGTHLDDISLSQLVRFIPTCVGNTVQRIAIRCAETVHPHMRGEHHSLSDLADHVVGSSPHAWGTHTLLTNATASDPVHPHMRGEHAGGAADQQASVRFIPTCVGNTATTSLPACPVCGSSPHAWGTHELYGPRWQRKRFIPTCVGNTPSGGGGHPHESGSSPHAWGTPTAALAEPTGYRFIPTCVGNTHMSLLSL